MTVQKATNIIWHHGKITKKDRENLLKQKGVVVWFTGLPSSGKSTIAHGLEEKLFNEGKISFVLDGDNIRHGLNKNLGFSPEDRKENIRRIGEVAKLFADTGIIVMTAFISPYKADRDNVRALLGAGEFIEVFVKVSVEVAEARDPKGLYKKAKSGEIKDFTGISAPYEVPSKPELIIDTDKLNLEESVEKVLSYLRGKDIIGKY